MHTADPSDQRWYVYDVWDSKEHFQRFVKDRRGQAIESTEAGGGAQPEPQFFPIETAVKAPRSNPRPASALVVAASGQAQRSRPQ